MKEVNLWFWGRGLEEELKKSHHQDSLLQEIGTVGSQPCLDGNRQQTAGKKETKGDEDGENEPVK